MSARNDGGPAFPRPSMATHEGMSLRDWFAGQALVGIAGCERLFQEAEATKQWPAEVAAKAAYRIADAMIAARDKK